MPEYVTKDNMRSRLHATSSENEMYKTLMKWIDKLPTEDVTPVIHAKWTDNYNGTFICSHCNKKASRGNYCQHCGARMDYKDQEKGQ